MEPQTIDEEPFESQPKGDEAVAAVGTGAVAGGTTMTEAEDKAREKPAEPTRESPKEKRGLFGRFADRMKSRSDADKQRRTPFQQPTPSQKIAEGDKTDEAADGAAAAGIPVAGLALAAAGGTDEARGEEEIGGTKPDVAAEGTEEARSTEAIEEPKPDASAEIDEDTEKDQSNNTGIIGASVAGITGAAIAAGVAVQRVTGTEPEEEKRGGLDLRLDR